LVPVRARRPGRAAPVVAQRDRGERALHGVRGADGDRRGVGGAADGFLSTGAVPGAFSPGLWCNYTMMRRAPSLPRTPATAPEPAVATRTTLWRVILRRKTVTPGDYSLSNQGAHLILRRGLSAKAIEPLAEVLDIGKTQLAPLLGVDRATLRRYVDA